MELMRFCCSKQSLRHPISSMSLRINLQKIFVSSESTLLQLVDGFHEQLMDGKTFDLAQYFVTCKPLRQVQNWVIIQHPKQPIARKVIQLLNDAILLINRSKLMRSVHFKELKNLLQQLYCLFQHSSSIVFKNEYLELAFEIYFLNPFEFHVYALVSICEDNLSFLQPYYDLMRRLIMNMSVSDELYDLLINGFCKRLSIFLDGKNEEGKQDISNCFSALIRQSEQDNDRVRKLMNNKLLLNQLLLFQYKSKYILNISSFISALAKANIPQCYKFQCILQEIIKVVLRSYGSMMGRLDWLQLLAEGSGFPPWFLQKEIVRPLQFLKSYTMEMGGVRFALQMIVVCVNDYPSLHSSVKAFLNKIDFWGQIKFYLADTQIQQLVKLYAEIIQQPQLYEEIVNNADYVKILRDI